jgi:peptidoglycan/xylan/chitin deacetylase (PgdA/CDA1 family)
MTETPYPRDLIGYGPNPPDPRWPNKARLALQIVLNYEEGGENSVLHGDKGSEVFLTETPGGSPVIGARALSTESVYEYGSRAGFWRLHRLFTERGLPITIYGVGMALMRHPDATRAMKAAGWEIASHSWRWIDYQNVPPSGRLAGTPAGSARRPGGWWWRKAASCTTPTATPTICLTGITSSAARI